MVMARDLRRKVVIVEGRTLQDMANEFDVPVTLIAMGVARICGREFEPTDVVDAEIQRKIIETCGHEAA